MTDDPRWGVVGNQKITDEGPLVDLREYPKLAAHLEAHRSAKGCTACHEGIDPWGLPFEAFDAAGLPRTDAFDAASRLPDGTETALTTDATPSDRATDARFVSPNGRFLVSIWQRDGEHRTVSIVEAAPKDQPQPKVHSFRYDKPGDRIDERRPRLFDLDAGTEIPVDATLFPSPWDLSDFLWLPDSSEFLFRYNARGHRTMRGQGYTRVAIQGIVVPFASLGLLLFQIQALLQSCRARRP